MNYTNQHSYSKCMAYGYVVYILILFIFVSCVLTNCLHSEKLLNAFLSTLI